MKGIGWALGALALALSFRLHAQPCGPCQPAVKPNFATPGSARISFYLDVTLTSYEAATMMQAMDAWNAWAYGRGGTPFLTLNNNPFAANVFVTDGPSVANNIGASFDNNTSWIQINPYYSGQHDLLLHNLIHELGHAMGFADVYRSGCASQTIMNWIVDPGQSIATTTLTVDTCTLNTLNMEPLPDPNYGSDPGFGPTDGWWCPNGGCDPLVLDLNGDGIVTTGLEAPVWFDLDGNGYPEHLTWTSATTLEGFLWVNLSGKNRVEDGSELFGIGTLMPDGTRATDGFQALAIYDQPALGGNGDGVLNPSDAVWNHLRVWIDGNHNGISEPSENLPLHAFHVISINLTSIRANQRDAAGNVHLRQGRFLREDHGRVISSAIDSIGFAVVP